jgi:hypothetical protein
VTHRRYRNRWRIPYEVHSFFSVFYKNNSAIICNKTKSPKLVCRPTSRRVTYLAYASTPKMEAVRSPETSVNFNRATRRRSPEDNILHSSSHFFHRNVGSDIHVTTFAGYKLVSTRKWRSLQRYSHHYSLVPRPQ